jgi:hypothetical protein
VIIIGNLYNIKSQKIFLILFQKSGNFTEYSSAKNLLQNDEKSSQKKNHCPS